MANSNDERDSSLRSRSKPRTTNRDHLTNPEVGISLLYWTLIGSLTLRPAENLMPDPIPFGRFEYCLSVKNLAASALFYEQLGFRRTGGNADEGWLILEHPSLVIGLFEGMFEGTLMNFRGADVFAIARELNSRDIPMTTDAHVESDGSVGAVIKDPDGNVLYFNTSEGEEIDRGTVDESPEAG